MGMSKGIVKGWQDTIWTDKQHDWDFQVVHIDDYNALESQNTILREALERIASEINTDYAGAWCAKVALEALQRAGGGE